MTMTMSCNCGKKGIYFRRYSGQVLCRHCFKKYIEKKFLETIRKKYPLKRGERIGCAISGGKDSLAMLYLLAKLREKLRLDVQAILIDEGIMGYREKGIEKAKKFCKENEVPLHIYSFKKAFGIELDEIVKASREIKPCSFCGVFRRKLLNRASNELELRRLAIGHNLDDEVQAILMNYIRGEFERLARSEVEKTELVPRVKPLSEIPEKEVMIYALLKNIDFSPEECPYAELAFRRKIRDFVNELEEAHAGIKFSIARGYRKLVPFFKPTNYALKTCSICGEASAKEVCKACELLGKYKSLLTSA